MSTFLSPSANPNGYLSEELLDQIWAHNYNLIVNEVIAILKKNHRYVGGKNENVGIIKTNL